MKAEVIRTGVGTVVAVSQGSRHSTDENNDHVCKYDDMMKVHVDSNWVLAHATQLLFAQF